MLLLLFPVLLSFSAKGQLQDDILGEWVTGSGKGHIKIERFGSHFYGKIVWLKEPLDPETGKPNTDKNNPNDAKKSNPVYGLQVIKDFVYDAENGEWHDGTIYDPENGKTYSCRIRMKDKNTLDVRGYVGISMLGRSESWFRIK